MSTEEKRKYWRDWYAKNKDTERSKRLSRCTRVRRDLRGYIEDYKLAHPCVDCGEADPVVLDFDHVRGTKLCNVADVVGRCVSMATLVNEICKCEIRCANCHRRKTHRSR